MPMIFCNIGWYSGPFVVFHYGRQALKMVALRFHRDAFQMVAPPVDIDAFLFPPFEEDATLS